MSFRLYIENIREPADVYSVNSFKDIVTLTGNDKLQTGIITHTYESTNTELWSAQDWWFVFSLDGNKWGAYRYTWNAVGIGSTEVIPTGHFNTDDATINTSVSFQFSNRDADGQDLTALFAKLEIDDNFKVFSSLEGANEYIVVKYKYADLYPDEGVIMERDILTETGLDNSLKQFTKSFKIPATPNNNELLSHWEHKANENIVNPNKSINARVEIESIYLTEGVIELLSVTWKNGKPDNYSIVFYSDASGLKAKIGNILLSDIDWSSFDFNYTMTNIQNSWASNTTNYFVPVIAWSRWFKWYASTPTIIDIDNINDADYGVKVSELRVGISLKEMVQTIGTHVKVNFVFDEKIDTYLNEAFIIPSKFEDQTLTLSPALFATSVETTGTVEILQAVTLKLIMDTIITDPRGSWDGTSLYTAEFGGDYTFQLEWQADAQAKYTYYLYDSLDNLIYDGITGNGGAFTRTITVTLIAGTSYYFAMSHDKNASVNVSVQMETLIVPASIYGLPYNVSSNMPTIKAVDFLSGFISAFNLIVFESDINTYTISDTVSIFEHHATVVDLEDYVNETELTYKKIEVRSLINFKHKENETNPNKAYFDINGKNYGQLYYAPDVDFSSGELEDESIFNIFPPAYIGVYDNHGYVGRSELWCQFQLSETEDPKPVLSNFLLMYRNGSELVTNNWYLQSDNATPPQMTLQTNWGMYSQVQDLVSTIESNTLTYSLENPFIGSVAENTIVNKFYLQWLIQLYKRTSYTLEISFPVSFGVFLKVTGISIIYLNGFYHMLASWSYNSATNMLTLKLLRYDSFILSEHTEIKGVLKIDFK